MNFRHAAFLLLADDALVAAHPEASSIRSIRRSRRTLADLLTQELVGIEHSYLGQSAPETLDSPAVDPLDYFRRLENLKHIDERINTLGDLPRPWRTIVDLPANSISTLVERVGLDVIASAAQFSSRRRLESWLERLGDTLGTRVVRRIADAKTVVMPGELQQGIKLKVQEYVDRFAGERLANELGRWALWILYRQLTPEARESAARLCRSSIVVLLDAVLEPEDNLASGSRWIEQTVRNRLSEAASNRNNAGGA